MYKENIRGARETAFFMSEQINWINLHTICIKPKYIIEIMDKIRVFGRRKKLLVDQTVKSGGGGGAMGMLYTKITLEE